MLLQHSPDLLACARSLHLYTLSPDISAVLRYADVSGHSSVVYVPFQMLRVPDVSRWLPSLLAPLSALEYIYQVSTEAPRKVRLPLVSVQYSSLTHAALVGMSGGFCLLDVY